MFIPTYNSEISVTSKEFGQINYNTSMEQNTMQSLKRCCKRTCNEMKKKNLTTYWLVQQMFFEILVYPKCHAGTWNLNGEKDKHSL